ncbi:MAG: zinc-ribbon domain-containing protein [Anaplasma sp.]
MHLLFCVTGTSAMKIECRNCHATYRVAGDKVPAEGKRVKCTNCGHVWLFSLEGSQASRKNKREVKQSASKNKDRLKFTWRDAVLILMMIPLLFFFSATFQKKVPYRFRKIYRLTEIYDTSNVKLVESNVRVVGADARGMVVRVSGVIENRAVDERFFPGVYLVFYDKNANSVLSQKVEVDKYQLIPSQGKVQFEKTVAGVPREVSTVKVKAGNAFEVLFY